MNVRWGVGASEGRVSVLVGVGFGEVFRDAKKAPFASTVRFLLLLFLLLFS